MTNVYPVPTSLSPSRMEAFTSCPLAFRFLSIERLPEPPSIHSTRGSLVHRALELLFVNPPERRGSADARAAYEQAVAEYHELPRGELHVFEHLGHFGPLEDPPAVAAAIADFFDSSAG